MCGRVVALNAMLKEILYRFIEPGRAEHEFVNIILYLNM